MWRRTCQSCSIACLSLLMHGLSPCAASPVAGPGPAPGTLFEHPENLAGAAGELLPARAGELFVAENRSRSEGPVISIAYVRLPSTARKPATPIFMLAGGPGESAIDELASDAETRAMVLYFREIADVILLDQRGAGHSRPRLDCRQRIEWPLDQPLTRQARTAELRKRSAQCRREWQQRSVDLTAYNTVENAADVDALRKALGYRRMSLIAGSYGTHLALALIRHFPQSIERAILYGVEGPDHTYDLPSQVMGALEQIAAAAEASPALQGLVPAGGLIEALRNVQTRLDRSPVSVTIEHDGQPVTVSISRDDVQRLARRGVHDLTDMSWPARIIEMHRGEFAATAEAIVEDRSWPIDAAMYFMMDCASGISPQRRSRIREHAAESGAMAILGDINLTYFAACDVWGSPDLGDDFRADVIADTPVLIFQGTWDVSTPYVNAEEVARGFRNGKLITVERGSHFTLHDLFRSWSSIRPLAREFLRGGAVEPPHRIVLPEPVFRRPNVSEAVTEL